MGPAPPGNPFVSMEIDPLGANVVNIDHTIPLEACRINWIVRGMRPARGTVIGPDAREISAFALPDYEDALGNLPTCTWKG